MTFPKLLKLKQASIACSIAFAMLATSSTAMGATDRAKLAAMSSIVSFLLEDSGQPSVIAYAYANQNQLSEYTVSVKYNYTGGTVVGKRFSTGNYRLGFVGLDFEQPNISFQVSAVGSAATCTVGNWVSSVVSVYCYTSNGTPVDSNYTLSATAITTLSTAKEILWGFSYRADEIDVPVPMFADLSFNLGGGRPSATKKSTGQYHVSGINNNFSNSVVHVIGHLGNVCNAQFWTPDYISISCRNSSNTSVDSPFSLVVIKDEPTASVTRNVFNLLATQTGASQYSPTPDQYFSEGGRAPTITRTAVGRYQISYPDLIGGRLSFVGVAMVTSANGNRFCKNTYWQRAEMTVECVGPDGNYADSRFFVHLYR